MELLRLDTATLPAMMASAVAIVMNERKSFHILAPLAPCRHRPRPTSPPAPGLDMPSQPYMATLSPRATPSSPMSMSTSTVSPSIRCQRPESYRQQGLSRNAHSHDPNLLSCRHRTANEHDRRWATTTPVSDGCRPRPYATVRTGGTLLGARGAAGIEAALT